MTVYMSRSYQDEADLAKLQSYVVLAKSRWHIGDLTWRLFYSHRFDPKRQIRLWENISGSLLGFAWAYSSSTVEMHTDDRDVLASMIKRARKYARHHNQPVIYVPTSSESETFNHHLTELGFSADRIFGLRFRRSLKSIPEDSWLPEGFMIRPALPEEVRERVALHQAAFGTQNVTVEGYRQLLKTPMYRPELDLVITTHSGEFVAFCLSWLDTVNKVGEIEPIGVHPKFQRQGFGSILLREAMERLHTAGMESVILTTGASNTAAFRFYESHDFTLAARELMFSKRL